MLGLINQTVVVVELVQKDGKAVLFERLDESGAPVFTATVWDARRWDVSDAVTMLEALPHAMKAIYEDERHRGCDIRMVEVEVTRVRDSDFVQCAQWVAFGGRDSDLPEVPAT